LLGEAAASPDPMTLFSVYIVTSTIFLKKKKIKNVESLGVIGCQVELSLLNFA